MRFLAVEHQLPTRVVTNDEVIGRVAKRAIPHDRLVQWDDLEPGTAT